MPKENFHKKNAAIGGGLGLFGGIYAGGALIRNGSIHGNKLVTAAAMGGMLAILGAGIANTGTNLLESREQVPFEGPKI